LATTYKRGSKAEKARISTSWWNSPGGTGTMPGLPCGERTIKVVAPRADRTAKFSPTVMAALATCWMLCRCPAGKRLAPMLATIVPLFVRDGDIMLSEAEAALLVSMSAASIDRHLATNGPSWWLGVAPIRARNPLKSQIPIRTWAEWSEDLPGFVEIDLVGHEGGNSSGEFCFTLTVTDIATVGPSIARSRTRRPSGCSRPSSTSLASSPSPSLGSDSDNGSEFINAHLLAYCVDHQITFTRSRPGNKNDGSHVEQKNWTHVRELVGYLRFDSDAELAILNQIWELDRTFTNYLLAQQKIVFKQRHGSKVTKRYDRAATPFERALDRPSVVTKDREVMHGVMNAIRPGNLYRQIHHLTTQLEHMALSKAPAPVKPQVNRAFTHWTHAEVLREAMNHRPGALRRVLCRGPKVRLVRSHAVALGSHKARRVTPWAVIHCLT